MVLELTVPELMMVNYEEGRKQLQWGPALFLGDNLSTVGRCYGMEAKPRQKRQDGHPG